MAEDRTAAGQRATTSLASYTTPQRQHEARINNVVVVVVVVGVKYS
jgi:hypothetical protein